MCLWTIIPLIGIGGAFTPIESQGHSSERSSPTEPVETARRFVRIVRSEPPHRHRHNNQLGDAWRGAPPVPARAAVSHYHRPARGQVPGRAHAGALLWPAPACPPAARRHRLAEPGVGHASSWRSYARHNGSRPLGCAPRSGTAAPRRRCAEYGPSASSDCSMPSRERRPSTCMAGCTAPSTPPCTTWAGTTTATRS